MKRVLNKAKVIAAFVLAIAYLGCEDVTNMFPDVTSAFTYTINEDTGTVTFLNVSEEADNYQWDFGDGTTSTEINPIKTYAESGTYTVTLRAVNLAGASDSSQDQVSVTITPVGGGGGDCTEETAQSLDAADFNLTFQTDPGSAIAEDGAAFSVIDNPDTDNDVNSSCKVGEIVRDASLPFANNQIEFDSKFDFTTNSGFKLKVWAPVAGTNVLLKLEDKTDSGINTEVAAVTVSGNAWEELTFDFPDTESGKYDKIVLFFDINTDSGATYYIDDFALYGEGTGGGGDCTAETAQSLDASDFNLTFLTDPGSAILEDGGTYSYIDNPDTDNAVNPSCKVGEIVRDASLPFANNQIEFDSKFDFAANSGFKLKVWAPVAGTNVLLKLEDKTDSGINTEVGAVTASGNAWEELTFDFPDTESGKYDKIVLFFDITTDSGATYYIDDFALYSGGNTGGTNGCSETPIAATALPVDFEGCETFLSSSNFGDGITSELTENPSKTGINTSDFVLQVDKPTGSSFFAGIQNTFASNFDLTTDNVFKIKIYSTKANAIFRFELLADPNDGSIGNPTPVYATVPNANEWTEVEFIFTNLPAAPTAYNQLVIKPDNDQSDSPIDNGATYYFDDLTLNAPSGGGGGGAVPPTAGPAAPTQDAVDVISIFSDTYTDVPNEGFNNYGSAAFEQVDLGGNAALKYTFVEGGGGNFQVIELGGGNQID
ncbi:MAG: PKD domain-containing protein, partial [Flavobacteriaceae bacterium]|nr:PKD domain-containing protein [Flavobacteriaceae bacterium]